MMKRKAVCLFLSLVMTVSLLTPSTLATGSGKNVYQNGTFTAEKLSNPTTGEGEADGLVPGGDRLNSYAWSMSRLTDEYGDYVYIGSNRNLMYFGVLQYADSLDNKALLTDILTNGEVPTDCTNYECYQAIIARYNLKTGEIEKYFDSADYGLDSPFGLIWGFRAAVTFKGALYMNANSVLRGSCLVRISGNDQKEPEMLTGVGGVGSSGVSSCTMRAMCVSEDGSTMYVGGMESSNGRDCYTIYKTADGETYEQIVGPKTDVTVFDRYEGAEYRTDGGDLWEITEYGGKLFVTLMTRKGAMVFTGQYDSTAGQWAWEEFAGEQNSNYDPGFGNVDNYTLSPFRFNGDLYFISFSNVMDALTDSFAGLTDTLSSGDINTYFDSLKLMDRVLDNETSVFRLTKDGKLQMVVGDKDKCSDNIEYVAKEQAGFNPDDYSTTTYNWRAAVYNGKLYIGTFDAYSNYKYLTKLTNGDLLNMNSSEFRQQLDYILDFLGTVVQNKTQTFGINLETMNDPAQMAAAYYSGVQITKFPTIEKPSDLLLLALREVLVSIQQNMDKQATTQFLSNLLLSVPKMANTLDVLSNCLDILLKQCKDSSTRAAIEEVKNAVDSIADLLGSIDEDGIERYVRISDTLAANNSPGFELYCTSDGINYQTVTLDGFNDEYNYGCRTLLPVDDGLLLGTANPFFGAQLWKITETQAPPASEDTETPGESDTDAEDGSESGDSGMDSNVTPIKRFTINASAGTGGSISPEGSILVREGSRQTFTIRAEDGYEIADVIVDGASFGSVTSYTFQNVKGRHTISATFEKAKPVVEPATVPFTDVHKGEWFYDDVCYVYDKDLMNGVTDDRFDPNGTTSRSMLVTVLWRLAGQPMVNYSLPFTDVKDGQWYTEAIRWAASEGIVKGCSPTKFGVHDKITREQVATMLYRYEQEINAGGFSGGWSFPLNFTDSGTISDWALEAMSWCVMKGIMNGNGAGALAPQDASSRAQMAAMLHRFCEL